MYSKCSMAAPGTMSRGNFLKLSGAGVAGVFALGIMGSGSALAQTSLSGEFDTAAKEYGVPVDLLLAIGYANSGLRTPPLSSGEYDPGDIHGMGGYGVMQLHRNPDKDTLGRAAELTGLSIEDLKTDRAANIMGGAAVLVDVQGGTKPEDLGGWYDAVADFGDGNLFAGQVYDTLEDGASAEVAPGETVTLEPQPGLERPITRMAQGTGQYQGCNFYGASDNFSQASRPPTIDKIIVHVVQGSWSSAINWFANPDSNVSAHYTVSRGGTVGQSVREDDIAWHCGWWDYNKRSIGIEHEGYISDPGYWFTETMYRSSASLTAYLCKKYNIPIDRSHIIGHNEVPGCSGTGGGGGCHTDPGSGWNWTKYISYVKEAAGGTTTTTVNRDPLPNSAGRYSQVVGDLSGSRFRASASWVKSSFHSDTNYGGTHRAFTRPTKKTSDSAAFRILTKTTDVYQVYAWWPADPGYNPSTKFRIKTTSGWVNRTVNQRTSGGRWVSLGRHRLGAGDSFKIQVLSKSRKAGYIIADAVGIVKR